MKKLALLISTTLLMGTQAFAANTDSKAVNLTAIIPVSCAITIVDQPALQADLVAAGGTVTSDVNLVCNSSGGATVSMASATGALSNGGQTPIYMDYQAVLGFRSQDASSSDLTLTANSGGTPVSVSQNITDPRYLVSDVDYPLDITLDADRPIVAGTYTDTLTLTLTAL